MVDVVVVLIHGQPQQEIVMDILQHIITRILEDGQELMDTTEKMVKKVRMVS